MFHTRFPFWIVVTYLGVGRNKTLCIHFYKYFLTWKAHAKFSFAIFTFMYILCVSSLIVLITFRVMMDVYYSHKHSVSSKKSLICNWWLIKGPHCGSTEHDVEWFSFNFQLLSLKIFIGNCDRHELRMTNRKRRLPDAMSNTGQIFISGAVGCPAIFYRLRIRMGIDRG